MFVGKTISPEPEAGSRCCAWRRVAVAQLQLMLLSSATVGAVGTDAASMQSFALRTRFM